MITRFRTTSPSREPANDEVCNIAINLANNCGFSCLPVLRDGTPATPYGASDASNIPSTLLDVWKRWPGPLIGFASGHVSAVWVLSVGPNAGKWWQANHHRLLPTRAYENRAGGVDLYFTAGDGISSTTGRLYADVDTHSDGSFVVHWFAAGLTCRDHSPHAPWPNWLRNALTAMP